MKRLRKWWNNILSALDAFFYGEIIYFRCEYCSFRMDIADFQNYKTTEKAMIDIVKHNCPVRSRVHLVGISRRFWVWYQPIDITKQIWGKENYQ